MIHALDPAPTGNHTDQVKCQVKSKWRFEPLPKLWHRQPGMKAVTQSENGLEMEWKWLVFHVQLEVFQELEAQDQGIGAVFQSLPVTYNF